MVKLHPHLIAIVQGLISEGKAGPCPFGIRLAIWRQAIKELNQTID